MASILEEKLREAACQGDTEAITVLLSQNIDINSQNPVNGWTALHWASKRGNEDIVKLLVSHGADKEIKNFKGETPSDVCGYHGTFEQLGIQQDELDLKFIPNYIKNPPFNGQVDIGRKRPKHTDFSSMPTTSLPTAQTDDLVLKIKIHGSGDPDFIEIEIPKWKLTYNNLLKICCEELEIMECQVERVRKLPNTRLRKDSDVKRLKEFQALELVLKAPLSGDKAANCYQSISTSYTKEIKESQSLLPSKSRSLYENAYKEYHKWCIKNKVLKTTEDSILTYFNTDLAVYKSSSLWTKYSMLRTTINLSEGVDISKFPSIIPYLKRKGEGYKSKKSLALTKEDVDNFLVRANNVEHLLNKVILIFGVAGACSRQELASLTTTCVEDSGSHFWIKLIDTNTKKDRSFIVVPGEFENVNLLELIRTYIRLRPTKMAHNRFFLNYVKEKCTVQPVGIHKMASVPQVVAKFLNLENPSSYTSHCFRRTSATLLANVGATMDDI